MKERLEEWLDEECADMRVALALDPARSSSGTEELVSQFRYAMSNTMEGRRLALRDSLIGLGRELWRTLTGRAGA